MTTSTPRYICTRGACYHVRPLTLMQQEVLYLCTYGITLPLLCRETFYPPMQVAQILSYLMQHGLVTIAPMETEPLAEKPIPSEPASTAPAYRSPLARFLRRLKHQYQRWNNWLWLGDARKEEASRVNERAAAGPINGCS